MAAFVAKQMVGNKLSAVKGKNMKNSAYPHFRIKLGIFIFSATCQSANLFRRQAEKIEAFFINAVKFAF